MRLSFSPLTWTSMIPASICCIYSVSLCLSLSFCIDMAMAPYRLAVTTASARVQPYMTMTTTTAIQYPGRPRPSQYNSCFSASNTRPCTPLCDVTAPRSRLTSLALDSRPSTRLALDPSRAGCDFDEPKIEARSLYTCSQTLCSNGLNLCGGT